MNSPKAPEGWKVLLNSKKDHYFREGRSLCGRWATFGNEFDPHTGAFAKNDCAGCVKKLQAELGKAKHV
jgi:hypothetical protein